MEKKKDLLLGGLFAVATLIVIVLLLTDDGFFNWAFNRHQNILSWYIRPLFIIPIAIFAFKRSYTGIFATIFALFTSMFWFPPPATTDPRVMEFLVFEMDYLKGEWTAPKIILGLAVPLFFILLLTAAWQRNWRWLLGVIIGAAALKVAWSVVLGGEAGMSVLKPALFGLIACSIVLGIFFKSKGGRGKQP